MITSIFQLSLDGFLHFQRICARPGELAVISLLDKGESVKYGRPDLSAHHGSLSLWFEDTYEEPGVPAWPDEPSPLQHLRYAREHGERIPTLADARRIVDFVYGLQALAQPLSLAVHCHGGISRSTAVADWVSARLFVPIAPAPAGVPLPSIGPMPNARVLRLLDKAWAQRDQAGHLKAVDSL